jgi:uncharacterized repeat protein (TIGR01451 family)
LLLAPRPTRRLVAALLACAGAAASPASADGDIQLDFVSMKRVVQKGGGGLELEKLVPVSEIYPGDEIKHSVAYTNQGDEPALAVKIKLPIPPGTKLIPGSVERPGTTVTYSVDGGSSFAPLEELTVTPPGGTRRAATLEDVDTIRWRIDDPVPPGQSGTVGCVVLVQ